MDDFCIQHQERYTEEEIDLELGRWITGELSLAEIMLRIRVFRACAI